MGGRLKDGQEWKKQRIVRNIVVSKELWSPSEKGREEFEKHLEELRAMGHDTRSVPADPLFVDPENLDFRFQEASPAISLGIERIDARGWGLTDALPFKAELQAKE